MQISFTVEGQPRGKGRPRFTRTGHAYTDQATKAYEHKVLQAWQEQSGVKMPDVPLEVVIEGFFQIPKSLSKKKQTELLGQPHTKKIDADNLGKIVLDSLNGHAFSDDNSVSFLVVTKHYDTNPRVEVTIWPDERAGYTAQTIAAMGEEEDDELACTECKYYHQHGPNGEDCEQMDIVIDHPEKEWACPFGERKVE